jgi:hypothetical protein
MALNETKKLNQEVLSSIKMSLQENVIFKSFNNFFENKNIINNFIPIVNSESKISIRLIDYFVTKYSKNNKVIYKIMDNNISTLFNVYSSYKQQLKIFQKKHFDPFSRGERIPFFISNTCIITTIGQLNFFKWFLSKDIYQYIKNNQENIEYDMNKKKKYEKIKKKENKSKYKTKTLYNNKINNNLLEIKNDKIIVSFN